MTKKILVVDDHPLIAQGIKMLIESRDVFKVTGIIHSLDNLWSQLKNSIDILVLDLNLKGKNSIELIGDIKSLHPNLKILIFSSYNKPSLVRRAFAQGADGYVLKDTEEDELLKALYTIIENKQYIGTRVAIPKKGVLPEQNSILEDGFSKLEKLTKREREVMNLIVEGFDNQTIVEKLFISKHTVQSHRKNIFKKLGVHSAMELIKLIHNL